MSQLTLNDSNDKDKLLESYPPLFRQAAAQNHNTEISPDSADSAAEYPDPIPSIDLEALSLESLGEACENWGLFRLVNHGVPAAFMDQLQECSRELFSLSFETKQALFQSSGSLSYFWGTPALSQSGTALNRGAATLNVNWVEGLSASLSQLPLLGCHEDPVVNSFRTLLEGYGSHMGRIARALFEAMAENLNLNSDRPEQILSEKTRVLRVYRYPIMTCDENTWGIDAHTDSSVISILCQDQVAGLEFLKDDNDWLPVQPVPNTLIVHIGDMMQVMSDDKYMSVKHRVKVNSRKERVSIGYFIFPHDDHAIYSSKYKPFTYSNFRAQVQQDLKTIGRKIGLERFKL